MQNKTVHMITFILLVIGGLNWLLVGLFGMDLVMRVFSEMLNMPMLTKLVYILVGLSAIYEFVIHKGTCTLCTSHPSGGQM
jgi:uncharacterized protein